MLTNKQVIRAVIDRKGHTHQTIIAIEEMAELTKELTKYIRGKGNHDHLLEEVADVKICIDQIQEMYNLRNEEVTEKMALKLIRLDERLRKEFDDK